MATNRTLETLAETLTAVSKKLPRNWLSGYLLGLAYFLLENFDKASLEFERALACCKIVNGTRASQGLLYCHIGLSQLYSNSDRSTSDPKIKNVHKCFKLAMELNKYDPNIWHCAGMLLFRKGQHAASRELYEALVQNFPNFMDALSNFGLALVKLSQNNDATNCFQHILQSTLHQEALNNYAVLLVQEKLCDMAMELLQAGLHQNSNLTFSWCNLGLVYHLLSKEEEAQVACDHAVRLLKKQAIAQRDELELSIICNRITYNIRNKEFDQAQKLIVSHWERFKDESQICLLYSILQREKLLSGSNEDDADVKENATSLVYQALERSPNDHIVYTELGLDSLSRGDYEKAQTFFKNALVHNDASVAAWSNLGVAMNLAENADVEKVYLKALELEPHCFAVLNNLGNLYRQLGKFEDALKFYERCLQLRPSDAIVLNNLALLAVTQGNYELAKQHLEQALHEDPNLDCAKSNLLKLQVLMKGTPQP